MWVQSGWKPLIWAFVLLIYVQIIAGAFVAGLDAGFSHNTWPLMAGKFIPEGLTTLTPWWLNSFENIVTVQFNHRMLAYVITAFLVGLTWHAWSKTQFDGVHGWMVVIAGLTVLQVILGILTLLWVVPIHLALAHQITAFLLCAAGVAYLADMSNEKSG